jgi:hypothetical protein
MNTEPRNVTLNSHKVHTHKTKNKQGDKKLEKSPTKKFKDLVSLSSKMQEGKSE